MHGARKILTFRIDPVEQNQASWISAQAPHFQRVLIAGDAPTNARGIEVKGHAGHAFSPLINKQFNG